jgi:hypothetical protein
MQDKRITEENLIRQLKMSRPVLDTESLANEVEKRILSQKQKISYTDRLLSWIFAWVNINWFRRVMVTASFSIVIIFIWQQAVIIERLENLERRYYQPLNNNSLFIQAGGNPKSVLLDNTRVEDLLEIISSDPALWEEIKKRLPEEKREIKN